MSSLKEHRTNKVNSRFLVRGDHEPSVTDNSLLNKGEILSLTFNNESIRSMLLLGPPNVSGQEPTLPPNSYGYFNDGKFTAYLLRENIIRLRFIHAYAATNKHTTYLTTSSGTSLPSFTTTTEEGLRYGNLGTLPGAIPDRASTLMVLYECTVSTNGTANDFGKLNVVYQTCTSAPGATTLSYRNTTLTYNMNDVSPTYHSRGLYVNGTDILAMPGVTMPSSVTTNETSKLIVSPPHNTKIIFFCCVREREHYPLINSLLALTNMPSSN